ncbi:MAG: A/G-specific adenine glycosylase [Methanoregulaceae archaeon]|jgi:A/G-specific adenine glycosylase|nr:A/G-specific adenine glycosylase [Methanoregulaceae archaeon]
MPGDQKRKDLPDERAICSFREKLLDFYRRNGRHDLLWRKTTNPYYILVSEIMLQQTQVPRVMVKYPQFISAFPDVWSLADASLADVLGVWKGMGYNRRAIALREIAGLVVSRFSGVIPDNEVVLCGFPGIGKATAGSIVAFAFNRPTVFIETNIRRVYIHCFFGEQVPVSDSEIMPIVAKTLDVRQPREWYYALMDYGSVLGRRSPNPNRRSTKYNRQTAFEGSDRQIRGQVLGLLLRDGTMKENELIATIGESPERTRQILLALARDGFVTIESDSVRFHP